MKTGICAIAADWELPYIMEWLEYHIAIGIDNFLVFLNDWEQEKVKKLEELIRMKGFPENTVRLVKDFNGKVMQLPAYNQGMAIMTSLGIDWCAFIDIDEFIKVRSSRSLKDILSDHGEKSQLSLNWRFYGSNGIEQVEETYDPDPLDITDRYSVLGRFTKCAAVLNPHVKQIINLGLFRNSHLALPIFFTPHSTSSISYGLLGEIVVGPFNGKEPGRVRELELAHYRTKSRQEYLDRRGTRRRADTGLPWDRGGLEPMWREDDKNDIDESELEWK